MPDRLLQLREAGQSIWLDYIDRPLITSGRLERHIAEGWLTGQTTNPTIFEKALAEGSAYDDQLASLSKGLTASEAFELIEAEDVRAACDLFAGVYEATDAGDGYVSIEVSPRLAHDADATVSEARRLWELVGRPNVMVKVPGTSEGARAAQQLLSEGINVNVTLLFALNAYERIIQAFTGALESRVRAGKPVDRVASVASFFVSRVDGEVDRRLEALASEASGEERNRILGMRGKAAIANAKLAYRLFCAELAGARWRALSERGAQCQRPLWASTSTKNPAFRDVLYVEHLIGRHTVNTMPPQTIDAFRDHGELDHQVTDGLNEAQLTLAELEALGISMADVTDKLLVEGLASFQKSFDQLTAGLEKKLSSLVEA
ncbi:MAG TPA: transaldolase [Gemmatimonadaceae bacterium]|nr:transaldolase [Gemmatimonadaceae bacterium]